MYDTLRHIQINEQTEGWTVSTVSYPTDRIANNPAIYLVFVREKVCGGLFLPVI